MTEPIRVGKLYFRFEDYERKQDPANGGDVLTVSVSVENTDRPLGEAGRPPEVELRDSDGAIYEPVNLDDVWNLPRDPDTVAMAHLRFRLPESSTGLEVVLAPGTDEEAHIELAPALG